MDTIHSSTHLLSLIHVHTLNEQQRSMNNNQCSMIDHRTMNDEHDDDQ
nr:MAG TPA: hypothetical protein [Caudoviricetes sp.]